VIINGECSLQIKAVNHHFRCNWVSMLFIRYFLSRIS